MGDTERLLRPGAPQGPAQYRGDKPHRSTVEYEIGVICEVLRVQRESRGKEVQLNCSALLNEKDVIYWNIWKKNGKDPNVHEEEGTRIRVLQCLPDGGHPPPKRSNFHPPPEQSSRGPQAQELLRSSSVNCPRSTHG
ncbi:hypothetical protein J1605_005552 [Eschrichtius robustus]|uniref:Uncharacterized protein n=1 Tax=Eschrichtius robustus TaxID=9764 RepID=A0AB34HB69_ESCRO|nr:hypothetical protein J1605_005552 [Eschrichtius robustus]